MQSGPCRDPKPLWRLFQEKMYDFERNKKNNLIFYGVRPKSHENTDSLKKHLADILRDTLTIRYSFLNLASLVYADVFIIQQARDPD